MLFSQTLVHQRPPLSPKLPNTNSHRHPDNMRYLNKIKIKIPKYDEEYDREVITWVSEINGIFAMDSPTNKL